MCQNFASPHCHSAASIDSASTPENFAQWEVEHGTGAITVTDHGTLAGARKVYDLATGKKFRGKLTPILGLEAYFRDDNCPILKSFGIEKKNAYRHENGTKILKLEDFEALGAEAKKNYQPFLSHLDYLKYMHITMHFLDQPAYEAGVRVLSRADVTAEPHGKERKPIFTWADLEELGQFNITFTSGCLIGMVQRHVAFRGRPDIGEAYYSHLRNIVRPGNFYVESFPHVCDRNWDSKVVVKFEDGTEERFPGWKSLATDKSYGAKKTEGFKAEKLYESWTRTGAAAHGRLRAVMVDRKWSEYENPKKIVNVRLDEGFQMNECTAFSPDGDLQAPANKFVMGLAEKFHDPVLISDDSHFVRPEEKIVQDIKLLQSGSWRFATSYHRFTGEEASTYYKKVMGLGDAEIDRLLANNAEWAARFKGFTLKSRPSLPTSFYPQDTLQHTWRLIQKHGRHGLLKDPVYAQRLREEIELLHFNGTIDLLPYFFVDEEVCEEYQRKFLLTGPGRGSAAGLLLTFLLEITHVDPLRYGLSKDRFLTLDRIQTGKLPDIDQDLPFRDLLIDPNDSKKGWLRDRFGACVVQISTDRSMKLKSAILDVHRVLSADRRVPSDVAQMAHKLPTPPQGISDRDFVFGYDNNGLWEEGILTTNLILQQYVTRFPKEWEIVQRCLGIIAGKGRHACGYVIANEPISNFIPTMEVSGALVTQPAAAQVESSGGLKMDFLTVNSLNDIQVAIRLIQERHAGGQKTEAQVVGGLRVPGHRLVPTKGGELVDIWDLPEDQAVFREICEGKTESVFQFGTPGAIKWLAHFNRERFQVNGVVHKALDSIEALAAFTALDRPGPLDALVTDKDGREHNMLVEFARRARGEKAIGGFPILDKLFPETYGILVYQEQVQKAFHEVGGTTAIQANDFRVHVSKKQMKEIIADKAIFMPGAVQRIGAESAEHLWQSMETFGQYAFNKSHAVCYVVIGYACAWLKHHYPLEWWTAVMRHASKDEIETVFWRHAGHLIDLPDVNLSSDRFEIRGERILAPLNMILGMGDTTQEEIVKYLPANGLQNFLEKWDARRVAEGEKTVTMKRRRGGVVEPVTKIKRARTSLNLGVMSKLIGVGALDSLLPEDVRSQSLAQKIQHYINAEAQVTGDVYKATGLPKKKLDPVYSQLTAAQQYQLKKKLLPAFTMPIDDFVPPELIVQDRGAGGRPGYFLNIPYRDRYEFATIKALRYWQEYNNKTKWPKGFTINIALPCYIISHEVKIYHDTKKRAEISIDAEGFRATFVRWPDSETGELQRLDTVDGTMKSPMTWASPLSGALMILALQKWSPERDFSVVGGVIVSNPLAMKTKETEEEDEDDGTDDTAAKEDVRSTQELQLAQGNE